MTASEVVVVCTGDVLGSPTAEAMTAEMRHRELGVPASSAGTLRGSREISPVAPGFVTHDGLDLSIHRSMRGIAGLKSRRRNE